MTAIAMRRVAVGFVVLLMFMPLALLGIGGGALHGILERRLSAAWDRPVTIARVIREDRLSSILTLRLEGVRIGQPGWVRRGLPAMATVDRLRVRLPLFPLLIGRIRPQAIELAGARMLLIRAADGRANWQNGNDQRQDDNRDRKRPTPRLRIDDARIVLIDRQRDRSLDVIASLDAEQRPRIAGTGTIRGIPMTLHAEGAPIGAGAQPGRWPFTATITGATLALTLTASAERPFDFDAFDGHVVARGHDLKDLDAVIEAGLPGTQAFSLGADVRRSAPDWQISKLTGTIGRSVVAGSMSVKKRAGRSLIEGEVTSPRFDLDDLASDAGLARAAAKRARLGRRVIPDSRIELSHMRRTDGTLRFAVARLLWKKPQPFASASGTLTLDHGTLSLAPLEVRLTDGGRLSGRMRVVHPDGAPKLTIALKLAGSQIGALFHTGEATGALSGRFDLSGEGETIRAALSRGRGSFALVARDGSLDARAAEFLGQNVGRAIKAKADDRVALNCIVAHFDGRDGRFTPAPFVIDTDVMRADAQGQVDLASERLDFAFPARSKVASAFRLTAPVRLVGTIAQPKITVPPEATSKRGILKAIGRALSGKKEPAAVPADCAALARRALG
jgi:uncharacterized protein involved in outer membrane biogenesis